MGRGEEEKTGKRGEFERRGEEGQERERGEEKKRGGVRGDKEMENDRRRE